MPRIQRSLTVALLTFVVVAPSSARAQRAAARVAPARNAGGYSSDSTAFVVGKQVHLRSSRTFIGTIKAVDERHDFRAGRFPRPEMKAVLIERRDGPLEWVPVERITRIYVVK